MNQLWKFVVIVSVALLLTLPAFALAAEENTPATPEGNAAPAVTSAKVPASALITFSEGIGAGLVIIGAGYGIGKIGSCAVESMARQPEVAGSIQMAMVISAALIEGATFFALVVCTDLL